MRRRQLLVALGAGAFAAPFGSFAQQPGKVWRIGILVTGTSVTHGYRIDAFVQALSKLGYIEGDNISFVIRFADGNTDRLPTLAADLVAKKVDIIVSQNTVTTRAAKQATSNIPIVFVSAGDPVGNGLIASLAKPGGNMTGTSSFSIDLAAKRLEILKEISPKIARIAIVSGDAQAAQAAEVERAAKARGMQMLSVQLGRSEDVKQVAARLKEWHADALDYLDSGINSYNSKLLGEFSLTMRLPAIAAYKEFVDAGALISYGPKDRWNYIRAATYVDKILKGAKPGDLPVEQPTQFEMVINIKTAKDLGIKIPQSILVQATKVIE